MKVPGITDPIEPSGTCRRCGLPTHGWPDGSLKHLTPKGLFSTRGCQSASFDWPGGRDRTIPRHWKAAE